MCYRSPPLGPAHTARGWVWVCVPAGNGSSPGPAVCLQDVAVDDDGVLAHRLAIDARTQRSADKPGDFLSAAAQLALDRLAVAASVGRSRQHRALGRHPALAPAA